MSQSGLNEIRMILDVVRRRKRLLIITIFCCMLLSLLPVFLLPSVYQSTAIILVESQEIPQDLVRSTVTGYVEERLQSISQITLNRANLLSMVEQHGLYTDERQRITTEEIVEKMRSDITMTPIKADVIGAGGRPTSATIAFSLSYRNKSPRKALNTTNSLVSLFLEENYRSREARATTTYDFLQKQNTELSNKINEIEAEIARFKEVHLTELPEMVTLNLQTMERTQKEIESKREYIRNLTDRKIYLEGQLATLSPTRPYAGADGRPVLHPAEELKVLRNQYISMRATRSDKHPDIIAIKQKIAALESYVGDNETAIADLAIAKVNQESKLAGLLGQYTSNHPEVQAAQQELAAISTMLEDAKNSRGKGKSDNIVADNPAYITVETQLKSVALEIDNEKRNMLELEKKYDDYQKRVEMSPQVEQDYRRLERDLLVTQAQYQENMSKLMAAGEAKILEEERAGERLTLIDPPIMPESPVSPNRILILGVGLVLSLAIGGGAVAGREILDSAIHGSYHVTNITKLPILVSIPYYATKQEKSKRSRQRKYIIFIGILLSVAMVMLCHFVFMPLDILFYTTINNLQKYF